MENFFSNHNYLFFVTKCYHLAPTFLVFHDPCAFRDPGLTAACPTVISDLHRKMTIKLFRDAGGPLTNLFIIFIMKGMS